jgi:uncharacterized metal-binding protein YceD (DUF177 family)
MKKEKIKLIIPFIGLKDGNHHFEYKIDEAFFKQFEYSIIQEATINVEIDFEKRKTMFNLHFSLSGEITSDCDRCGDSLTIEVDGKQELIVKFGDETYSETDEIKIIRENEYELDLTDIIYEYAHLLLPSKITHDIEADCNQIVIEQLNNLSTKEDNESTDPRWDALSKLNRNKD